jgi:type IV secretory pathway VirB2 component (pilin)
MNSLHKHEHMKLHNEFETQVSGAATPSHTPAQKIWFQVDGPIAAKKDFA